MPPIPPALQAGDPRMECQAAFRATRGGDAGSQRPHCRIVHVARIILREFAAGCASSVPEE